MNRFRVTARLALVATSAMAASLAVEATPVTNADFVTVRYEGVVEWTYAGGVGHPCTACKQEVGDRVSGTVLINVSKAPPDVDPGNPLFSRYSTYEDASRIQPSFIGGDVPQYGKPYEYVQMSDSHEGVDFWNLVDQSYGVRSYDGRKRSEMDSVFLNAGSVLFFNGFDFVHGDGIAQNIDLTTAEIGTDVFAEGQIGFSRRWLDDPAKVIEGTIGFVLTRLTVKPGYCSI